MAACGRGMHPLAGNITEPSAWCLLGFAAMAVPPLLHRSPMQIIAAVTLEHRSLSIPTYWPPGVKVGG